MATAVERVFDVPELLEAIITQLPLHKILVVQRVSKEWHDAITSLPSIQHKLFLKPDGLPVAPNTEALPKHCKYTQSLRVNEMHAGITDCPESKDYKPGTPRFITVRMDVKFEQGMHIKPQPAHDQFIPEPPCTAVRCFLGDGHKSYFRYLHIAAGVRWKDVIDEAVKVLLSGKKSSDRLKGLELEVRLWAVVSDEVLQPHLEKSEIMQVIEALTGAA